uniref:Uncharacterized protein n=1 Tax=Gossypium raimondii TaxID=29730 RepID=A0A0D2R2C2_GOSRA|nr:hypothetical protein B456_004G105300 [Gossypium raimondii]
MTDIFYQYSQFTIVYIDDVLSWHETCHEEDEKSSSKSSKNTIIQDAQDPNEIGSQIKKWIESLSQSPEVSLAFSQMKEETPLKQIVAEAAKKFPAKFTTKIDHYPYFTYWDYQMAWYNSFLMNNQHMRHSWLIYFKYGTQFKFPNKFQEWWNWYGPSSFEILPEKIQNLWPKFFDKFHPGPDQKHIYRTIYFFSKLCISWIVSWNYSYEQDQHTGIPLLVRNSRTKWWDKFNDEKYDSKYLDNFFNKNPRLCKSAAPDQTTAKFLQAKSTASAMLAQAKTKKEYKKLMAEMLSSLDSKSEDESSASSIKKVDLADDTTLVTITRSKKK